MISLLTLYTSLHVTPLASVGLWVSGSHDLGEIASEIAGNLKRDPLRGSGG